MKEMGHLNNESWKVVYDGAKTLEQYKNINEAFLIGELKESEFDYVSMVKMSQKP